jgi:hypothetical protein
MQALVKEVLAAWREAERVAAQQPPGSADHDAAVIAIERLRNLFTELTTHGSSVNHEMAEALLKEAGLPPRPEPAG